MRIPLLITLKDDLVISASSATTGTHESLDYLPGSLILGVAAAKLYKPLKEQSKDQLWQVFHSGDVCFQNGYILSEKEGYASYPPPLSIHYYKGEEPDNKRSIYDQVVRMGISQQDENKQDRQPKQLRKGYVTDHGHLVNVNKAASMKTAIDNTTGRAATSQLFGYQAIQAGARFLAYLDIAASVPKAVVQQIKDALTGTARMGRSRSAQYGRVEITCLAPKQAQQPTAQIQAGATELTIWCLSDLALSDLHTGQPTLTPSAAHFGLPQGTLDLKNSFMRSRSYSPFNAYRNSFDSQRQVISQGSVLRFKGLTPLTDKQINALQQSFGRYTEMGLGQIALNADLCIASDAPKAPKALAVQAQSKAPQSKVSSPLIHWLQQQTSIAVEDQSDWVATLIGNVDEPKQGTIAHFYKVARQFNALDRDTLIGPSASQWGELYQRARDLRHEPEKLIHELFLKTESSGDKEKDRSICRERAGSQHSWGLAMSTGQSFNLWLAAQLLMPKYNQPCTSQVQLRAFIKDNPELLTTELCQKITQLAEDMRTKKQQAMRSDVKVERSKEATNHA